MCGQGDATVTRILLRQGDATSYVEGEDYTSVSGSSQEFLLIAGIGWHPIGGRSRHVLSALRQRFVERLAGRISALEEGCDLWGG